jgi:hypothetical protein
VSEPFDLTVDAGVLRVALRPFARLPAATERAEAVLSFADGVFRIALPGLAASVPADGNWPHPLRMAGTFMPRLHVVLPEKGSVRVSAADGRVRFGNHSFDCVHSTDGPDPARLPLDPSAADLLRAAGRMSWDDVIAAGIRSLVDAAEEERDDCIFAAAELLAPYGVTEDDVAELVAMALERGER